MLGKGEKNKDVTLGKIKKIKFPVLFSVKHCPQHKNNYPETLPHL